jgi:uncharacterized membrane protein
MSDLIAVAYDDVNTAETVRAKLFDLQRQQLIAIEDAVVVERTSDGKVKLRQIGSSVGMGAAGGALWGGLIGLIFLVPFLGAAVGAAAGAAAGSMADSGIDDNFMRQVGEDLQPGKAALFVLLTKSTPEKVLPEVAPYGGHILRTSLSPEAEERLREAAQSAQNVPSARQEQSENSPAK